MRLSRLPIALAALWLLLLGCNTKIEDRGPAQASVADRQPATPVSFVDATEACGIDFTYWNGMTGERYFVELVGGGGALFDMDNDGDLDLYLVQGGPLIPPGQTGSGQHSPLPDDRPSGRLYRNDLELLASGDRSLRFTDVTVESGLNAVGYGMGVATGDYDNDGYVDLYLSYFGANQLWRNCGSRGSVCFEDVTDRSGVDDSRWSTSAAFVDIDADGLLDLYVANYVDFRLENHRSCFSASGRPDYCGPLSYNGETDRLFHNRGDGTFEDITVLAGLLDSASSGLGVVAADFDRDGFIDIYVANDMRRNFLWRNLGGKDAIRFENVALETGSAVSKEGRAQASMGVVAADFDNDGDEDLFMTHLRADYNTFYRNDGKGYFQDFSSNTGLAGTSMGMTGFGTGLLDFDNDGWQDLAAVNGSVNVIEEQALAGSDFPLAQPNQLFHNRGDGTFAELGPESCEAFALMEVSRGLAAGDVDNDGLEDMIITNNNGPARLLLNRTKTENHWVGLRILTRDSKRDALGSLVSLVRSDGTVLWRRVATDGSYLSACDPRVLIGLGKDPEIAAVRVQWPDGGIEEWKELESGRYHDLVRGTGGAVAATPAEVVPKAGPRP